MATSSASAPLDALADRDATTVPRLVAPLVALNLADAAFTIGWIELGLAQEANPMMAYLLELHPLSFLVTKMGLVVLALFLLLKRAEHRLAQVGAAMLFVVYVALFHYHLHAMSLWM